VIPRCQPAVASLPGVECSNGPIEASISGGRSTYKGLLVRAEKRFGRRFQAQVSVCASGRGGHLRHVRPVHAHVQPEQLVSERWAPLSAAQVLNISGIANLPLGLEIAFISSFNTRGAVSAGDFERGLLRNGHQRISAARHPVRISSTSASAARSGALVDAYNQTYAGKRGPNPAQVFQQLLCRANSVLGGLQFPGPAVTKAFRFGEHFELRVFTEVFNVLNYANLTGYENDLLSTRVWPIRPPGAGNIFGTAATGVPSRRTPEVLKPSRRTVATASKSTFRHLLLSRGHHLFHRLP